MPSKQTSVAPQAFVQLPQWSWAVAVSKHALLQTVSVSLHETTPPVAAMTPPVPVMVPPAAVSPPTPNMTPPVEVLTPVVFGGALISPLVEQPNSLKDAKPLTNNPKAPTSRR
jgi:hypothetical protein